MRGDCPHSVRARMRLHCRVSLRSRRVRRLDFASDSATGGYRKVRSSLLSLTAHPTAAWTVQQLREAFPRDKAPRFLIHDRDSAFDDLAVAAKAIGIGSAAATTRRLP